MTLFLVTNFLLPDVKKYCLAGNVARWYPHMYFFFEFIFVIPYITETCSISTEGSTCECIGGLNIRWTQFRKSAAIGRCRGNCQTVGLDLVCIALSWRPDTLVVGIKEAGDGKFHSLQRRGVHWRSSWGSLPWTNPRTPARFTTASSTFTTK